MLILDIRKGLASEAKAAIEKAKTAAAAAEAEGREMTAEERGAIDSHLAEARRIQARIDALTGDAELREQIAQFASQQAIAGMPAQAPAVTDGADRGARRIASLGAQFVASAIYRESIYRQARPRGWRAEAIELEVPRATLTSDPASGGALIVPDYQAGIIGQLFAPPVVADLFAQGTTDSNAVIYMSETAATNGAAAVAEGQPKPESSLTFAQVIDQVKKIATWLGVTDEMLDDVPQLRSYIDGRLRIFVEQEEDDQVLNGDGIGPNLLGIRNRAGLAADIVRAGTESNADAIFRQITAVAMNSLLFPDAIVMNPADWANIVLTKTVNGEYLAASPFQPRAGATLWGLSVHQTPNIPSGTALVGAFKAGGQVFRKGGITVEATNAHADFFIRNMAAIRAEERLALAVYRAAAFGEVTSLLAIAAPVPPGTQAAAPAKGEPAKR